jgi:pimeloyl-ACP methyl ester carboxylesterase
VPLVRRSLVAFAIAVTVLVPAEGAAAGDFTQSDVRLTMSDGVRIAVSYFEPVGTPPPDGWPAVILLHGLAQRRITSDFRHWSPNVMASRFLAPEGYAVLTYDARAHGESEGLFTLDGPRELEDLRELLTWLTLTHNVDARRVGAYGASYGGGLVWRAAVEGFPFAAIAPAASWTDLAEALMPQGLVRAGIVLGFAQSIPRERYGPDEAVLLADLIAERNLPAIRAYLASRSTRPQLGNVRIPTFMLQGRRDFAFDADQAIAAYRRLRGPKMLYLGTFGHAPAANPVAEFEYLGGLIRLWFDKTLKGTPRGPALPPVMIAPDPWRDRVVRFGSLPNPRRLTFALGGTSALSANGKVVRNTKRVRKLETFGLPTVKVSFSTTTGYKHLVAVLSAVTRRGEIVIADGGAATPGTGRRTVTIRLQNEITSIPAGARLRVTLGARSTVQNPSNLVYLLQVPDGSVARIGRVVLTLPVLRRPVSR